MTRRIVVGALSAFLFMYLGMGLTAQDTKSLIGAWRANMETSKFSPGPAPKSQTRTFEDRGSGVVVVTTEATNAQGEVTVAKVTLKYDGRDYPQAETGVNSISTVAAKLEWESFQKDILTVKLTFKNDGKVTSTGIESVSRDGRTLLVEQAGTTAEGQKFYHAIVFEKQ